MKKKKNHKQTNKTHHFRTKLRILHLSYPKISLVGVDSHYILVLYFILVNPGTEGRASASISLHQLFLFPSALQINQLKIGCSPLLANRVFPVPSGGASLPHLGCFPYDKFHMGMSWLSEYAPLKMSKFSSCFLWK